MSSKRSLSQSSRSTRTTDPRFPQKILENGIICGHLRSQPPQDLEELKDYLAQSRRSGSPEATEFEAYLYDVEYSNNEATLRMNAFQGMRKPPVRDPANPYIATAGYEWSDVGDSVLTKGLSRPKPDYAESYAMTAFPAHIVHELTSNIQPSPHNFSLPRMTVEFKSPNGGSVQAEAQAAYNGAIMVERIIEQKKFINQTPLFGKTQALTMTFTGRNSGIYACHAIETSDGIRYHAFPVFEDQPMLSGDQFSITRRHIRNAQDWSLHQSKEMLEALWKHTSEPTGISEPAQSTPSLPTLVSSEEVDVAPQRPESIRRSKRSRKVRAR